MINKIMKVRIYYDGYANTYLPQYRWFGIWFNFRGCISKYGSQFNLSREYDTKDEAIKFLDGEKLRRKANRNTAAAGKERAKKSGVAYEDVI
jgi:predicted alpha/beta-fold hydrolase